MHTESSHVRCFRLPIISLFFFLVASPVFATRSVVIEANKQSLLGDEEMAIIASPSGFTSGEIIYVKGAFYQEGSTNYFGYTKNSNPAVPLISMRTAVTVQLTFKMQHLQKEVYCHHPITSLLD